MDQEAVARAFVVVEQAAGIAVAVAESSDLGARQLTYSKVLYMACTYRHIRAHLLQAGCGTARHALVVVLARLGSLFALPLVGLTNPNRNQNARMLSMS